MSETPPRSPTRVPYNNKASANCDHFATSPTKFIHQRRTVTSGRGPHIAIFQVITFLIKAIVGAIASLLVAVFTHVVPAIIAVGVITAIIFAVGTSFSIGGLAFLRKRKKQRE